MAQESTWEDPRATASSVAPEEPISSIPKPPPVPPLTFEPIPVFKPVGKKPQPTKRRSTARKARASMLIPDDGGKRNSMVRKSIAGKRRSVTMRQSVFAPEEIRTTSGASGGDLLSQLNKAASKLKHVESNAGHAKGGVEGSVAKILANRSAVTGHEDGSSSDGRSDDSRISFLSDDSDD